MRRREFITFVGGAAVAWPLGARGQQPQATRRIAMLNGGVTEEDLEGKANIAQFLETLQKSGWIVGRNLRLDARWGGGDAEKSRRLAGELVALAPDVILTSGTVALGSILKATSTVPVVFVNVADPVGAGFVESLARPGGNATGLMQFEYNLSGKWLELLKEIAPNVTRAAVLRDPSITAGIGQFAVIQAAAATIAIEVRSINMSDAGEIERSVAAFTRSPNGGLIITTSALAVAHRKLIIALAAHHKLPAVYYRRRYAAEGGLVSYGYDIDEQFRLAAGYVDRILKGENPADLPVQAPTKYELVINLKTAKALGLTVPPSLLIRAHEVIE
jgi:putative ABC transport system substrate-binding protein